MHSVPEIPSQHGPIDNPGPVPGILPPQVHFRMLEVLTDKDLSPSAKVLYALLDELGQGQPVVLEQHQLATMLDTSRKTVTIRLGELRERGLVAVTVHQTDQSRHAMGYATRTVPHQGPQYLVPDL